MGSCRRPAPRRRPGPPRLAAPGTPRPEGAARTREERQPSLALARHSHSLTQNLYPLCRSMTLQGKVVLVTGAARGQGRAYALAAAAAGADLAICDVAA